MSKHGCNNHLSNDGTDGYAPFFVSHVFVLQVCVRERARKSLLSIQDIGEAEAGKVVDSVFDACFRDTEPFERVPP